MDNEVDIKNMGKAVKHSENEGEKSESEEASEEDAHDEQDSGKGKQDKKKTSKKGSVGKEKVGSSSKKVPTPATTKSPIQSSSKRSKTEYDDDIGTKATFTDILKQLGMKGRKSTTHRQEGGILTQVELACKRHSPVGRLLDFPSMSGGHSNSRGGAAAREQDRFLPIANVSRIMKKALPANAKISKDAKETVQECVSEFISFVTGEASDKCQREKRKTINGDDLLWAMTTLGFEDYVEPLKVYLQRFRETEGEKAGAAPSQSQPKDGSDAGGGPSTSVGGGGMYGGGMMMMMGQQMYGTGPPSALQPFQHHHMTMGGINSLRGGGEGGGADGGSPSSGSRQRHDRI
ncbi:hypothetical protein BHM03_00032175 [Ensete ventricosum]|uniref:Transcription factor CBF/NF-Y/archaeal histone domain-containing protein n=1 Tax=Ensete ventricosum TaxID=4639 RepID=A0A445MIL5_ENSVE|nr:hypothetical protein BHM03_00032175 [Ensete ventricosum]